MFTVGGDAPPVEGDDLLGNGQPQARAAGGGGAGLVQTEELLKEGVQLVGGNGLSPILHEKLRLFISSGFHPNRVKRVEKYAAAPISRGW